MKKTLTGGAIAALILAGVCLIGAPANAAYDPACVPSDGVDAYTETIAAVTHTVEHVSVYETVIITPAVKYQAATYATEYEFTFKREHPNSPRWEVEGWNADDNDQSTGWSATGATRQGAMLTPEILAADAVTEERLVSAAWLEVVVDEPEVVIEHPAVDAVTCDDAPPMPEPVVTSSLGEPGVDCETLTVTTTETRTTTPYTWTGYEWVLGEPSDETLYQTREASAEECPPVVVTPPPVVTVPPLTPVAVVTASDAVELAHTGAPDYLPLLYVGGLILVAGLTVTGAATLARVRRR